MGKLNYANRKVDGPKLGQIIEKDLLKRIPPRSGSNAAVRDPFVDLNVVGKHLSDNGVLPIVNGLVSAYSYPNNPPILHLEELHLADNALTVSCLIPLSTVIHLCARDIQDIDLSHNNISVSTDHEVSAWESFLASLEECAVLRRLDLSHNPLGPRAFEALTRAYAREETLELSMLVDDDEGYDPGIDQNSWREEEVTASKRLKLLATESEGTLQQSVSSAASTPKSRGSQKSSSTIGTSAQSTPSPAKARQYANTRGIRSIPYIILSDTTMTDICALHLSYVLACHHFPGSLMMRVPPAKAGLPTQQLEAYDAASGCRGVVYLPNDGLSSAGTRLLEIADYARSSIMEDSTIDVFTENLAVRTSAGRLRRASTDIGGNLSSIRTPGRRRSTLSMTGIELAASSIDGSAIDAELERARSKVQGNTLRDFGARSVDLWRTAMRTLVIARAILLQSGTARATKPCQADTYATKLDLTSAASGEPIFAITGVSTVPKTPIVTYKDDKAKRKTRSSPSIDSIVRSQPVSLAIKIDDNLEAMPGGLEKSLWVRIITDVTDPHNVMSNAQSLAIIDWARDRRTLSREREILGKADYAQIWRTLEGVGCLAYDIWA